MSNRSWVLALSAGSSLSVLITCSSGTAVPVKTLDGGPSTDGGVTAETGSGASGATPDAALSTDSGPAAESGANADSASPSSAPSCAGTPTTWRMGPALPVARIHSVAAAPGNGYVYVIDGYTDAAVCNVGTADGRAFYAKENADGSLGPWMETVAGTGGFLRSIPGVAVANGYIYIGGGAINGPSWNGAVWFTKPNADGSIASWTASTNVAGGPVGSAPKVGIYNGVMYMGGGFDNQASPDVLTTFYRSVLDPATGQPGPWTQITDLPVQTNDGNILFYNDKAYMFVGHSSLSVYIADVDPTNGPQNWTLSSVPLPEPTSWGSAQLVGGKIFLVSGATTDVFASAIGADGSLGAWCLSSQTPTPYTVALQGVVSNGFYYLLGDTACEATPAQAESVLWGAVQ